VSGVCMHASLSFPFKVRLAPLLPAIKKRLLPRVVPSGTDATNAPPVKTGATVAATRPNLLPTACEHPTLHHMSISLRNIP
jgi:hypothetical protein